jgi:hypothetical protein
MDIWKAMYGLSDMPKKFGAVETETLILGLVAFVLPITEFVE